MNKEVFEKVLVDAWMPPDLAAKAAEVAAKYYPDNTLLGATEEEVQLLNQTKEYLGKPGTGEEE